MAAMLARHHARERAEPRYRHLSPEKRAVHTSISRPGRVLPLVLLLAALACKEDSDLVAPVGTQIGGQWTFTETYADDALGVICNNSADVTIVQSGTTFTGTSDQTGTCTDAEGPYDNSWVLHLQNGQIVGNNATWDDDGAPECDYTGVITGTPTTNRIAGVVQCIGTVDGVAYNLQGTWELTR